MDSTIRLRQINQAELSGFISKVVLPTLQASGYLISGINLLPTSSGLQNLGSISYPYNQIFTENIQLPSGSGINFGNTLLTAYTSGSNAVIQVNGFIFSSSPTGLSIIGPSGASGATGPTGPTGQSGIGVTGVSGVGGTGIKLLLSNGTFSNSISLLSGATGVSGVSLTGFSQLNSYTIQPLYSNGSTGSGITLPTGAQGIRGIAGGINLDVSDFTGFSGNIVPQVFIYDIDPLGSSPNPDINLVKGMTYTIGYSGLNVSTVTITGNGVSYPTGTFASNYFTESGITGYFKLCFFDNSVLNLYSNPYTGRFTRQEIVGAVYSDILAKVISTDVYYNEDEDTTRGALTFTTKLSSANSFKYGFQKYNFFTQSPIDNLGAWGFYVLGSVDCNYFGPTGQPGSTGPAGIPGAQGERGFKGTDGTPGASVTGIERNGNDIRFLFSNGTNSDYTTLPAGGPTGPAGSTGPTGPSGLTGPTGPQGAQGIGDSYVTSFNFSDTSINGTGQAFYKRVSGSLTWSLATGTGRRFAVGDEIQFYNNPLIGLSYTPWQKLLFADTPATRGQYFYGDVTSFDSTIGLISFIASTTPAPIGLVSGQVQFDNYNIVDVNLGGLGSTGPTGPTGVTGPQGTKGDTGNQVFMINSPISGVIAGTTNLAFNTYDAQDLFITGAGNILDFNFNTFSTGQTVMLRIANSGVLDNTGPTPLISWDSSAKFPYNVSAPGPIPNTASIYTFIRYPDYAGAKRVFCTYSINYGL